MGSQAFHLLLMENKTYLERGPKSVGTGPQALVLLALIVLGRAMARQSKPSPNGAKKLAAIGNQLECACLLHVPALKRT